MDCMHKHVHMQTGMHAQGLHAQACAGAMATFKEIFALIQHIIF